MSTREERRLAREKRCKERWESWSSEQQESWLKKQKAKKIERAERAAKEQANLEPLTVPEGKLTITIALNCYNYQHRLCWMLSSILQQKGNVPDITVDISYCPNNGTPTTEEVCRFFREQGLNIIETVVTEEEIKNRAISRNKQIQNCNSHWMLLADGDMAYDPYFFDDLQKQLKTNLSQERRCIGGDRVSLEIGHCEKYFDEKDNHVYPCVIKNVTDELAKWPVWYVRGRKIAAGYFQLVNMQSVREKGGYYVKDPHDSIRRYNSDRHFRCHMGGRIPMMCKPQYHLNHERTNPEKQR